MYKCEPTKTLEQVDLPALQAKYRQEATKRVRSDGYQQYQAASDGYADFYERDPNASRIERDAIIEDIDVAILGGGFAGLIAGAQLKTAGINSIKIIDMAGDFGGTWYWNRYPGAQCDVESYVYLPMLEELGYMPKHNYAYGPEIFQHCQRIGQHFGLYEHALFGTIVRTIRWDNAIQRWRVGTDRSDEICARFLVMAGGYVNKPKLPGIPGIQDFKGHSFHTCRWDYDYTGGTPYGGLHKLHDKRVAVIGTGATAVQCVPYLGKYARHLNVFQRTPSYIDERNTRETSPEWAGSLQPGWQAERQRAFHLGANIGFAPGEQDLICDGWSEINRNLAARLDGMGNPALTPDQITELRELEDYRAMERIRQRVDAIVPDKDTAEALKAWYRFNCKRPCFNDDYLPAFNRPNVTLVDVSGSKGVERVTEKGIVANGVEYEVDCIVYASGFEITYDLRRRFGIDIIEGREGISLYDQWADGFQTLYGMTTHNFPNFFYMGFGQGSVSGSVTLGYELQASHISYIIAETMSRGAATAEPSQAAQDEWGRSVRENSAFDEKFFRECTPGYFNNEGELKSRNTVYGEPYPGGYYAFEKLLNDWRESGDMKGFIINA